jgi:asparagine synthase (glutamine-hydrolysing)
MPSHLIGNSKKGFAVPLDDWLRSDLREWAENLLSVERLKKDNYFNVNQVRNLWDAQLSGKYSHGNKLWSILIFQDWLNGEL